MQNIVQFILPIYFVIYFGIAFVLKSIIVAKRIGKNPNVLPKDDSAYGLIGFYFKLLLIIIFVYTIIYAFFPKGQEYFFPIEQFNNLIVKYMGFSFLLISLVWTIVAQNNMKNSWRIGIDTETRTELVTHGLFSISRNPIFFGMILSLIGLFLTTPNAWTFLFLILGYVLIQIQIRLEEDFLTQQHGQKYVEYKQKVRRLI
ncbi:MAG: isoprenylcysteine carboxylmethyltransferase family protein [Flavobacteriaceae bacterium]|jgi:protein-S-isoprenylcysteine O-methyltransferase Ste14|nr:isoprenylcysteine carboxylmethyltransferase family protein [Flavobacteriaceae bacterium]